MRAYDICPEQLAKELLRLGKIELEWLKVFTRPDGSYAAKINHDTWLNRVLKRGADVWGAQAVGVWLLDGPKSFKPTAEQCAALEQIEVRLDLHEYAQPYPALLVGFPDERYAPFTNCLCYHRPGEPMLSLVSHSADHGDDITTTIRVDGRPMEESLQRYDADIDDATSRQCGRALRVAVNACLALANFGCQAEALRGPDIDRDRKWSREQSERGERARERLATAVREVRFDQHVKLIGTSTTCHERDLSPTGRERGFGWVRGHWRMQAHGPGNSLRKRILIKPYMVRADKLVVELSETSVEYTG